MTAAPPRLGRTSVRVGSPMALAWGSLASASARLRERNVMDMQTATATPAPKRKPGTHFIEASVQGERYALYRDSIGGLIIARVEDGWSTYLQRGGEAARFWVGLERAQDSARPDETQTEIFDREAAEFDGLMLSPKDMHGAPDEYGDFWHWTAPDRRAA